MKKTLEITAGICAATGLVLVGLWWNGILYDWITPSNNVIIWSYGFHPPDIAVKKGSTVIWENRDPVPHKIQSGKPENSTKLFESGLMYERDKFQYTFNEVGTYEYYCVPHPLMEARIVVIP